MKNEWQDDKRSHPKRALREEKTVRKSLTVFVASLSVVLFYSVELAAKSYRWGGTELNVARSVLIPKTGLRSVLVTEFFHQGQIDPEGRNVLVVAGSGKLAPVRILQLGPGDLCRLAIQTLPGQDHYTIFYGGKAPNPEALPAWTNNDGLVLETRRFKKCDLDSLKSVREAFQNAVPYGADYVPTVFHSSNPFLLDWKPFLSRYSGYINVPESGQYGFLTSSEDCSFLLIDGRLVTSSPGCHRPANRVAPWMVRGVTLSAGTHKFEYYHAAEGDSSTMMAAWVVPTKTDHVKLSIIPPNAFHGRSIEHVQVGPSVLRSGDILPDFGHRVLGEVELPNSDEPMVFVNFTYRISPSLRSKTSVEWDFGDGQTGQYANVDHVYLRPGLYRIRLTVKHDGKTSEATNWIYIDRPRLSPRDRPHTLEDYLEKICDYDVSKLNAASLRQFLWAYLWKSQLVLIPPAKAGKSLGPEESLDDLELNEMAAIKAVSQRYINAAVAAGRTAFLNSLTHGTDSELFAIAETLGTLARSDMNDPALAIEIWKGAAEKIKDKKISGICRINAADIGVNDLIDVTSSKRLLESATVGLSSVQRGPEVSLLHRVWGDYYAAIGRAAEARNRYNLAQDTLDSDEPYAKQIVKQGIYSRSAEHFLRIGDLDRAIKELHRWGQEFPAQNISGHLPLLLAEYLSASQKHRRIVALAERMIVVNPNSTYNDRLLFLAADSEMRLGNADRAIDSLRKLVELYPGSGLVSLAQKNIDAIEANIHKETQPTDSQ